MSARQGISLLLMGAIHLTFLVLLIIDPSTHTGVKALLLLSFLLIVLAYARAPRTSAIYSKSETLVFPFALALAGVLTYYLSEGIGLGPVIPSATIGFIVSYFPTLFKSDLLKGLPAPIYCGTFVGMCSSFMAEDYFFVAYAGLVAGVIFILTRDVLDGIGGKLGSIAFGGVVFASFIFSLL